MYNCKKGSDFENEFAELLSKNGFWAHVVAKAKDGSQPCDIIAGKNCRLYAFDCKTVGGDRFSLSRVEENQEKAFSKLYECGCEYSYFVFKRKDGSIWLTNALDCIREKQNGIKSIEPGIYSFEKWCGSCES